MLLFVKTEFKIISDYILLVTGWLKRNFPYYLSWFWSNTISKFIIWLFLSRIYEACFDGKTGKRKRKIKETIILLKMTKKF